MISRRWFGRLMGAAVVAPAFPLVARDCTPKRVFFDRLPEPYTPFQPPIKARFRSSTGALLKEKPAKVELHPDGHVSLHVEWDDDTTQVERVEFLSDDDIMLVYADQHYGLHRGDTLTVEVRLA